MKLHSNACCKTETMNGGYLSKNLPSIMHMTQKYLKGRSKLELQGCVDHDHNPMVELFRRIHRLRT